MKLGWNIREKGRAIHERSDMVMLFVGAVVGKTIGSKDGIEIEACVDQAARCKLESPLNYISLPLLTSYGVGGVAFQAFFRGGGWYYGPTRICSQGPGLF
jgi:hypothetical protein